MTEKQEIFRWEVYCPDNEQHPLADRPAAFGRLFNTTYGVDEDGMPFDPSTGFSLSPGDIFDEITNLPIKCKEEWFQSYEGLSYVLVDDSAVRVVLAVTLITDWAEEE